MSSLEIVIWEEQTLEVADAQYAEAQPIDQAVEFLEEIGQDLEDALNFIRQYQRVCDMLAAPDPNGIPVKLLLQKYKMNHTKPAGSIAADKVKQLKAGNDRSLPA